MIVSVRKHSYREGRPNSVILSEIPSKQLFILSFVSEATPNNLVTILNNVAKCESIISQTFNTENGTTNLIGELEINSLTEDLLLKDNVISTLTPMSIVKTFSEKHQQAGTFKEINI